MQKEDLAIKVLKMLLRDNEESVVLDDDKGHDYDDYLGKNVFIRTVTNFYTGKLEKTTRTTMTLSSACWIADTGRFNEAMKTGEFSEVEPYFNDITVNLLSFEDITEIPFLPTEVK